MSKKYVITAFDNPDSFKDTALKDGVDLYEIDFSPWAEENGDITSVTWTVKSGTVGIDNEALADSVAQAQLTFSDWGGQLVQVKATNADNEVCVIYLEIAVKDLYCNPNDYGFRSC